MVTLNYKKKVKRKKEEICIIKQTRKFCNTLSIKNMLFPDFLYKYILMKHVVYSTYKFEIKKIIKRTENCVYHSSINRKICVKA